MTFSAFPHLFSPITIAQRVIRNRVALAATLTNFGRDNTVTDRWVSFLVERAQGGTGLVISEVIAVDPEALAQQAIVNGFDDANDAGFRAAAEGVDAAGGALIGQLWHPGRQQLWHPTKSPMGVSEQPDALSWTVPHVMSSLEIERVVEAYVRTAARLQRCGFAGVELHGAHGYLIGQFLSPWSNNRDDVFGGDVEGRTRFVRDIGAGIRTTCGRNFIVGLKMPGDEGITGGISPDEAERLTRQIAATGDFDYLSYGQGNFSLSLETHVPDLHFRPGHFIDIHKRMRAASAGLPVMALGRINTPALAERVIAEGYGDLVGMARALIADAAWAEKARRGRLDIRPTIFDNWCWGEVHLGKPLAEHNNPYLGNPGEASAEASLTRAAVSRQITVVGAGPAGLEAAWVAAARGHQVTLYGASPSPGGRLRLDAALPGRSAVGAIVEYQHQRVQHFGVKLRFGKPVDGDTVLAGAPDVVVLATGASLRPPPSLLSDGDSVTAADAYVLRKRIRARKGRALFFDMDHGASAYAVIDLMMQDFEQVVLITPRPQIAQNVNYCSAIGVQRRLYEAEVEIIVAHDLIDYRDKVVTCRNVFTGKDRFFEAIEEVIFVTPRTVTDVLGPMLSEHVTLYRIGDCQSPRHLLAAIHGGHHIGLSL
ncbi:MAG: NAD(P)-binding protein [Pseudomonadota bacterium]|nr:NAD(P)-binding protein [Pseudomonadota bacterium]